MQAIVAVSTKDMSREKWLEYRKLGIGGSDAAVVCGINRWKSPVDLWLEKTGQKELEPASEAAYWGTVMEPLIRDEFTLRTGIKVNQVPAILQHKRFPWMLANLDGVLSDPERGEGLFEAKTANAFTSSEWEEGIPEEYAVQIQHYMAVTGLQFVYIAALIGGNRFIWKLIERNDAVIQLLVQIEYRFWQLVQKRIPPQIDGSKASTMLLNRLYPQGKKGSIVILPNEAISLIQEYEAAIEEESAITLRKEQAVNRLKEMLGEAESGSVDHRIVTWKTVNTERLDTRALKADLPDIHQKYVKASSYRRFAIK